MRRSSATRSSISSYRFRRSPRSAALPGRRAGLFQSKLVLQHVVERLHRAADSPQKDQAPAIVSRGPPRYHNPAVWYCCMLSADRDNPESRGRKVRRCLSNSGATTGFARVGFAGITRSPKLHAFKDFARFATRSPKSRSRFDATPFNDQGLAMGRSVRERSTPRARPSLMYRYGPPLFYGDHLRS